MPTVTLTPVDAVDVTILVDNFVDVLMTGSDVARRGGRRWAGTSSPATS